MRVSWCDLVTALPISTRIYRLHILLSNGSESLAQVYTISIISGAIICYASKPLVACGRDWSNWKSAENDGNVGTGWIATQNSNVWSTAVYHKIKRLCIKLFSISTQVSPKSMNLQCLYPHLATVLKYRSITQNRYPLGRTISPLPPFRSTPSLTFNIRITR